MVFARTAIQKLIEEFSGATLTDKVEYCLEVRADLGSGYWRGGALGEGKLMAAFELQARGYLKIGAALDALEEQERFLGAAFYFLLRRSLYRWIRLYDHTDAECDNEQLHEWMAAMKRHGHENNMMAIEARLNSAQGNKRANEQRRANEQNQRQSNFADYDNSFALPAITGAVTAAVLVLCGIYPWAN